MTDIIEESERFTQAKRKETIDAMQIVSFRLTLGVDLAQALEADLTEKMQVIRRLERMLERERLKGCRRHWSYDLNRHIALSQVLRRLRSTIADGRSERRAGSV